MTEYKLNIKVIDNKAFAVSPGGEFRSIDKKGSQQLEQIRREFEVEEIERRFDEIIDFLTDAVIGGPEYEEKVAEIRALEIRLKKITENVPDRASSGIREVYTRDIKNMQRC